MNMKTSLKLDFAICQVLKIKRMQQSLSMRYLSCQLKVPHSFIGKVEQGERILSSGELDLYSLSLGLTSELVISKAKKYNLSSCNQI